MIYTAHTYLIWEAAPFLQIVDLAFFVELQKLKVIVDVEKLNNKLVDLKKLSKNIVYLQNIDTIVDVDFDVMYCRCRF